MGGVWLLHAGTTPLLPAVELGWFVMAFPGARFVLQYELEFQEF
jgi:hypothetical protein